MHALARLRVYLTARAAFTPDELATTEAAFVPRSLHAGEFFQRAGEPARHAVFVAAGCLRSYAIDGKGAERVVQFAPEDWWLSDVDSLMTGQPSRLFVDAIEDSEVLLITPQAHLDLVARVRPFAMVLQAGMQRHTAAKDARIVGTLTETIEDRYEAFLRTYASIAQRVPQWMIASYLGVTPETISRIRAKAARR